MKATFNLDENDSELNFPNFPEPISQGPKTDHVPTSEKDAFLMIFGGEIEDHILNSTNERREKREEIRNGERENPQRGRPLTTQGGHEGTRRTSVISLQDLHIFISLLLNIMLSPQRKLSSYWASPNLNKSEGGHFYSSRMGKDRWLEILGCLDFKRKELEEMLTGKVQSLWNCSIDIAADESMVPYKGRRSPHHVFIPHKPHPNGLKLYTAADS